MAAWFTATLNVRGAREIRGSASDRGQRHSGQVPIMSASTGLPAARSAAGLTASWSHADGRDIRSKLAAQRIAGQCLERLSVW